MQDTKFQLWVGRWQQQDAEWKATVEDGAWRLRPLGTNELASFSAYETELADLNAKRTGLPYVLVVRVKGELSTRVPLFPNGDVFWTLSYFLNRAGKPEAQVEVKTEDLPDAAAKIYEMFAKSSTAELANLANCWVCKRGYVTADPIVRFQSKRLRDPLSAHFLCAVVRAADVLGHVTGTALYIDPVEKLSLSPEKLALLERASLVVHGPECDSPQHMDRMHQELHDLCRAIGSRTPYRDGMSPKDLKDLKKGKPVLRLLDALVGVVVEPIQLDVEKVGRNEPCPCGSGDKYKRCCGANSG